MATDEQVLQVMKEFDVDEAEARALIAQAEAKLAEGGKRTYSSAVEYDPDAVSSDDDAQPEYQHSGFAPEHATVQSSYTRDPADTQADAWQKFFAGLPAEMSK